MPDYIFMLQSRLSPEQWQLLNRLQDLAQTIPVNLYLVGGAVRDLMTGSPIRDLDFAVEGNVQRFVRLLDEAEFRSFQWEQRRRAAEIDFQNGVLCSIELARTEIFSKPGELPEVKPAPILEDLRRRDFSINAIGISLNPGSRGLLLDPTNGLADLESRTLRLLHNYSFLHDPVRVLRLVRFRTRLGLTAEPRTEELFELALEKRYTDLITAAAAGCEMTQLTREDNPTAILKAWQGHGLLEVFHDKLQRRGPDYKGLGKFQKYRQAALSAGYVFDPHRPVLFYVMRRLKSREAYTLLRNIGLRGKGAESVVGLESEAKKVAKPLSGRRVTKPRQIYDLLQPVAIELLVFTLTWFSQKRKIQAKVYNYLFRYRPLRQQLPVRELELLGVPHGAKFDEILERFFYARLDGKLRNRAKQVRFLNKLAGVAKPAKKTRKAAGKPRLRPPAAKSKPAKSKSP